MAARGPHRRQVSLAAILGDYVRGALDRVRRPDVYSPAAEARAAAVIDRLRWIDRVLWDRAFAPHPSMCSDAPPRGWVGALVAAPCAGFALAGGAWLAESAAGPDPLVWLAAAAAFAACLAAAALAEAQRYSTASGTRLVAEAVLAWGGVLAASRVAGAEVDWAVGLGLLGVGSGVAMALAAAAAASFRRRGHPLDRLLSPMAAVADVLLPSAVVERAISRLRGGGSR